MDNNGRRNSNRIPEDVMDSIRYAYGDDLEAYSRIADAVGYPDTSDEPEERYDEPARSREPEERYDEPSRSDDEKSVDLSNIKFILEQNPDVNIQDNNGQTAFHLACLGTVAALLTLMLSKKPNVFLEDKMGNRAAKYLKTPEMKEIYNNYLGIV